MGEARLRAGGGCVVCATGSGASPKVEAIRVASSTCSQLFLSKGTFFKVKRLSHGHTLNSVVWLLWEVKLKGEGEMYLHYYEYLKSLWFLLPSLSFSLF